MHTQSFQELIRKRCIREERSLKQSILHFTGIDVPRSRLVNSILRLARLATNMKELNRLVDLARDSILAEFERQASAPRAK